VLSIGRKWAALDKGARCTIGGLMLDCGGYGARRLYADRDAYEARQKLIGSWRDLFDRMPSDPPACVTPEIIDQIYALLGMGQKDEPR
jgi:hypothetical protein